MASFIKKAPITRLLTFDNKKPISVFWSFSKQKIGMYQIVYLD